MGELVVATFNVHAGVDGWGMPFDVVGACAAIDADVVVLEESFTPEGGASLAEDVAGALGWSFRSIPLAPARRVHLRAGSPPPGSGRWGPRRSSGQRAVRLALPAQTRRARLSPRERRLPAARGTWDLAVLSRLPVRSHEAIALPALRRDGPRRQLLRLELDTPGGAFTLAGTHLAHLSAGSPVQIRALGRLLSDCRGPAALLGDMNCFGLPLTALLPGWRRAVRGPSWPSWWPCCQPDHVLVNGAVTVTAGEVLRVGRSDHLPVRAVLTY